MEFDFVEEIVTAHSDSQTLNFDRPDSSFCPASVDDSNINTEYLNKGDISSMSSDSYVQTIEPSYFVNSGTRKNELNHMTRVVMESVPYNDGLQYLAAISSFSDNFKVLIRVINLLIKQALTKL